MAKLFSIILLILCVFKSKAQTDAITAGQITDMIHTVYQPGPFAIQVPAINDGLEQQSADFDLDHDGVTDFSILLSFQHLGVVSNAGSIVFSMAPDCYVKCVPDTYTLQPNCPNAVNGDTVTVPVVKNFKAGDTIFKTNDTLWQTNTVALQSYEYGCPTALLQDLNNIGDSWAYHAFKLIKGNDTLLAYALISNQIIGERGGLYCYISNYAIQGNQNTINVPTAIATLSADNFKIYPIPFSNEINIEATSNCTYNIYAVTGTLLLSGSGNKVNTQALPEGSYILEVSSNNSTVRRVVVKMQ